MDSHCVIVGQPPVAVNSIRLHNRAIDVGFAKQSRPAPLLALARRVAEILGSVLAACRYRESSCVVPRFRKPENRIVFCDGTGWPTLHAPSDHRDTSRYAVGRLPKPDSSPSGT